MRRCDFCWNHRKIFTLPVCCLRDGTHSCLNCFDRYWTQWEKNLEYELLNTKSIANDLTDFYNKLANEQKDIPPEFEETFRKHEKDLLAEF